MNMKFCENFCLSRISADKRFLKCHTTRSAFPKPRFGSVEPHTTGVVCVTVCNTKIQYIFEFKKIWEIKKIALHLHCISAMRQ